jgi:hypothetical protein
MIYKTIQGSRKIYKCAKCEEMLFWDIEEMIMVLLNLRPEQTPYFWDANDWDANYTIQDFNNMVKENHNRLFNDTFGKPGEVIDRFAKCSCCGHENWYNCFHDDQGEVIVNLR